MTDPLEILLVEDNPYDAELTISALKNGNLANNLVHVKDGQAALDILLHDGAKPKVVLLDLKLPKVDGIEVLRQLRANPSTKRLPVVALTSSREASDIVNTYNLGVNSFIVKPVEFEKFSKAVIQIGLYWLLLNEKCSGS